MVMLSLIAWVRNYFKYKKGLYCWHKELRWWYFFDILVTESFGIVTKKCVFLCGIQLIYFIAQGIRHGAVPFNRKGSHVRLLWCQVTMYDLKKCEGLVDSRVIQRYPEYIYCRSHTVDVWKPHLWCIFSPLLGFGWITSTGDPNSRGVISCIVSWVLGLRLISVPIAIACSLCGPFGWEGTCWFCGELRGFSMLSTVCGFPPKMHWKGIQSGELCWLWHHS